MAIWKLHAVVAVFLHIILVSTKGEVCVTEPLPNHEHGIQGRFCIIDETTIVIRNFYYDSGGPDAYLYYYDPPSTATTVSRFGGGHIIRHPQSTSSSGRFPTIAPVINITLQFSLPTDVYACDMAVFTIWCRWARSHFTTLDIPPSLFTTDPNEAANGSKILCTRGMDPTTPTPTEGPTNMTNGTNATSTPSPEPTPEATPVPNPEATPRPNVIGCQQLAPSINLQWDVDWNTASVRFTLCGCLNRFSDGNTWLGFGLSGSNQETQMEGADVAITWIDRKTGNAFAEDYFLSAYTQCQRGSGACPDTMDSSGICTNDVTLVAGSLDGFKQCVTFSRNFMKGDQCDKELDPDKSDQFIVWGAGPQGQTAFRHFINANKSERPLHLANPASSVCSNLVCLSCPPYSVRQIRAPYNTTFVAHIGPSGNERGYTSITGLPSWGIAWYINGTLIPELVVQRGTTYTFIVYGGDDSRHDSKYHPFYITSSKIGGIFIPDGMNETVYAGFNDSTPLGVGPLCDFTTTEATKRVLDNCTTTLADYETTLKTPDSQCEAGALSNTFTWTPDEDTPDTVYYQCASHYGLGWQIKVKDIVRGDDSDDGDERDDGDKSDDGDDIVDGDDSVGSGCGLSSSLTLCLLTLLLLFVL